MSAWTKSTPKFKVETDIFTVKMATTAAQAAGTKWTDMTNRLNFAGSACEVINTDFTGGSAAKLAYPIWCHHPDTCNKCDVELLFLNEDPFLAASGTSGYAGLRTSWQAFLQDEQYDNAASPAVKQQKFLLEAKHKSLYSATLAATLSGTTLAPTSRRSLLTVPNAGLTQAYGKPETNSLCNLLANGTNVLSCASGTGASPTLTAYFASRADRATVLAAWAKVVRKPLPGANGLKDLVPNKLVDHGGTESKIIKLCIEGKGSLTDGVSKWGAESTGLGTANSACGTFSASGAIHCVAKECNKAAAGKSRQLNTVVSATQQIELSFARGASTDETAGMYAGFQSSLSSGSTYQFTILKADGSVALSLEYETSLPLYSSTTHKPMVASSSGAVNGVTDSACKIMGHSRITKALTCSNTAVTAAKAGTTILSFGTLADARTGAQEMHATAVNGVGMELKKYAGAAPVKETLSFTAVQKITKSTTRKYDQAGICAALAALKGDSLDVATFVECHVAAEVATDATGKLELVYLTAGDAGKAAKAWLAKGKTEATVLAFAKDATLSGVTTTTTVAGGGGDGSSTTSAKPTGTNTTASVRVVGLALAAWCSVLVFA
jgi:hypothetical protein